MTGEGSHAWPAGKGENPDFLMAREVFLQENLASILYLVIVNPRVTIVELGH